MKTESNKRYGEARFTVSHWDVMVQENKFQWKTCCLHAETIFTNKRTDGELGHMVWWQACEAQYQRKAKSRRWTTKPRMLMLLILKTQLCRTHGGAERSVPSSHFQGGHAEVSKREIWSVGNMRMSLWRWPLMFWGIKCQRLAILSCYSGKFCHNVNKN